MSDDIKENILSQSQWLRILTMVLFAVICWVLGIVMTVLVIGQALFSLITGRDNDNLRQLGGSLSIYFYQVLGFLTYNTDERPFPFAPFPSAGETDIEADFEEEEDSQYAYEAGTTAQADKTEDDVFADISFTSSKESHEDESSVDAIEEADEAVSDTYDANDENIPTVGNEEDSADSDEEKKPEGQ